MAAGEPERKLVGVARLPGQHLRPRPGGDGRLFRWGARGRLPPDQSDSVGVDLGEQPGAGGRGGTDRLRPGYRGRDGSDGQLAGRLPRLVQLVVPGRTAGDEPGQPALPLFVPATWVPSRKRGGLQVVPAVGVRQALFEGS